MSRQFRHRVTAVALGGLFLGAPLLTSGTADAGVARDSRQVTFGGGGWFGFSCRSSPDVESMRVPASSTVLVINRTGHDARLLLGGTDHGLIKHGGATRVQFRHGATSVALEPSCSLDDDAGSTMITTDSPSPTDPGPDGWDATSPDNDPASAQEPFVDSGPIGPAPDAPASASQHLPPAISHGGGTRPTKVRRPAGSVTAKREILPPVGAPPKAKIKAVPRTPGKVASPLAVLPPDAGRVPAAGVPKRGKAPAAARVPAAATVRPTQVAAADTVATMQSLPPERPIGLLALVASVCAVGVGVAAIRAFVAERASRARIT